MYKTQKAIVENKAQLIAAFHCAISLPVATEITLILESGKEVKYFLRPNEFYQHKKQRQIKKAIAEIRKIKAKHFR